MINQAGYYSLRLNSEVTKHLLDAGMTPRFYITEYCAEGA